jgi:single-strand DNA-binding protein
MIKLQIIGNLGKDCIQKDVNGKNVINFNVAHQEKFKDAQGNLKERTTWVNCAYWTDRTGIVPYLKKGQQVYVEGTPDVELYTNKENQPAATLRLRVQSVQLLGGRPEGSGQQGGNGGYAAQPVAQTASMSNISEAPDDLPF